MTLRKSGLTSLAFNRGSQQMNNGIIVKYKRLPAQTAGEGSCTFLFGLGRHRCAPTSEDINTRPGDEVAPRERKITLSATATALCFPGRTGASLFGTEGWDEGEGPSDWLHCPVSTARTMPSEKTVRMGDEGKAVGSLMADGFAVCGFRATLARYLEICKRRWVDPGPRSTEDTRASSLADFPPLRRLAGPLASLFSFARFASSKALNTRSAKSNSRSA
jgi:hypothetical protein